MLETFRQQSGSWVIWTLLSIIILAFIFTFNTSGGPITGRPGAEQQGVLVEVYGEPITSADVELAMRVSADPPPLGASGVDRLQAANRYEKTRLLFSGVPNELFGLVPFDGPVPPIKREKVMTELIESVLVGRDARERGLSVSDKELTARVLRLQAIFGTTWTDDNGNFEPRKYDIFVRYQLGTTKTMFENFLRREILRDKMAQIATTGIKVSDKELDAVQVAEKKRPQLEYVSIDANAAKVTVEVTDEDAAAWAKKNADKVKAAYEAAGEQYNKPGKWSVRGILFKAPNKEGLSGDALKEAEAEWSTKKTAAAGLKKELDDAIAGKIAIAAPPATSGGDDEDKKEAKDAGESKKITDVPEADRARWIKEHVARVAGEKTEHDLTKDVGGLFPDDKSVEALGRSPFGPAVATAVQAAQVGDVVGPVEGSHGWWVIRVEGKIDAKVTPLAAVEVKLAKGLVAEERAAGKLDEVAKSVLAAATAAKDKKLSEVVKGWNKKATGKEDSPLIASTSGQIGTAPTRAMTGSLEALLGLPARETKPGDIPGMGNLPEVEAVAWKLNKDAPLADKVFKSADGKIRYVVRWAEVKPSGDASAEDRKKVEKEERDSLRSTIQSMRRTAAWQTYVKALMTAADKDEEIERTDAWLQIKQGDRKRYADAAKKVAAKKAAPAANPFNVKVGNPTFGEPKPEPAPAPAPEGGKAAPEGGKAAPEAPKAPAAPEAPKAPAAPEPVKPE